MPRPRPPPNSPPPGPQGGAEPPAKPPAKRPRGQEKPKTEALLTEEDLDAGIHWNGLLAMLTKITKSDADGAALVQNWLNDYDEQLGGKKTREAMLAKVKGHIQSNKEPKLRVSGSVDILNVVAYSEHENEKQKARGTTKRVRWYYISGQWYSTKPGPKKGRLKKTTAAAAASPACDHGPALRETVVYSPPRTATICVNTTSSLELTHVQLRRVPFFDQWCGAVPNHSEAARVAPAICIQLAARPAVGRPGGKSDV